MDTPTPTPTPPVPVPSPAPPPTTGAAADGTSAAGAAATPPRRSRGRSLFVASMMALSGIYLLNFTLGVFELPDNLPIIGNLDEVAATTIFLAGLRYFGIEIPLFDRDRPR